MASFPRRDRRRGGGRDHRQRHHSGRAGNDGQADDRRGRGLRACRLRLDAAAILLCESDGTPEEVEERDPHDEVCPLRRQRHRGQPRRGATPEVLVRPQERLPASAHRRPRLHVHGLDHSAPSPADMLRAIAAMEDRHGLRCANVFHAGDGNLHPLILFDANGSDQSRRARGLRRRDPESASRWAARSPASTAGRREAEPDVRAVPRPRSWR